MNRAVTYFLIIFVAVLTGLAISLGKGYIVITYDKWAAEMPLWFGVLAFFLLFYIINFIYRIILKIRYRAKIKDMENAHNDLIFNQNAIEKATMKLFEGKWSEAENLFTKGINKLHKTVSPAINYIGAAIATHGLKKHSKANEYILSAQEHITPESEIAIDLIKAKLLIADKKWESALDILLIIRSPENEHLYILSLLKDVYINLNRWKDIRELLPVLRKFEVLKDNEMLSLEIETYDKLFENYSSSLTELEAFWDGIPRNLRSSPILIKKYCKKRKATGAQDDAVAGIIEQFLNHSKDDELILFYGLSNITDCQKQLSIAEQWLREGSISPTLLLSLGLIAIRCNQIEKAKNYFNRSLQLETSFEASYELGRIYESENNIDAALATYKKGLESKSIKQQ